MLKLFRRFQKDERGATAIEYALLTTMIGIALITGMSSLGVSLNNSYHNVNNAFN